MVRSELPAVFPDLDLPHGVSLCGRLTADDTKKGAWLRAPATSPPPSKHNRSSWSAIGIVVLGLVVLFAVAAFPPKPRAAGAGAGRVDAPVALSKSFAPIAFCAGAAIAVASFIAYLVWSRRPRAAAPVAAPQQYLFQDEQFYLLGPDSLTQRLWTGLTVRESNDFIVLEGPEPDIYWFPRRFASDDSTWHEFSALVHRKLSAVPTPAPPKPVTEIAEASFEAFDFDADWASFPFRSTVVAESNGSSIAAEALPFVFPLRDWLMQFAVLAIPAVLAAIGLFVVANPSARALCFGVIGGEVFLFFLLGWSCVRQRRGLRKLIDTHSSTKLIVRESHIEQRGESGRTFYRWNRLRRGAASDDDMLCLWIGDQNTILLLPRRVFPPHEWTRLWARAASLPMATP